MKNVLTIPSIVAGSKNGGGAGGTTNYDDLTNKPKVNGIILSGNKTSADLGITTLTPFPSTWPTTGQFEDLLAAIRVDTIAVKGASFLGEVTFDDLPANLGNAEIKIEILEGTTSATKVIHSVITSGNREPYRWEYTSWNSGNSNSGWISFQLPLTAGNGISIENNVISATGGADVPEDVYTQSNLLAGNGIEIVDEPVEGGIDKNTLACWHFDEDFNATNLSGIIPDITYENTASQTLDSSTFKFSPSSLKRTASGFFTAINSNIFNLFTNDFTIDFWHRMSSNLGVSLIRLATSTSTLFTLDSGSNGDGGGGNYVPSRLKINNKLLNTTEEPTGTWNHIACCFTYSTKTVKVFLNGTFYGETILDVLPTGCDRLYLVGGMYSARYDWFDELRISNIARPLTPDGKFPVPTKPYSVAEPTGNKVVNNTITKTSQLINDSGFLTSVPENLVTTDSYQGITGRKDFADLVNFNGGMRASTIQLTNNEPVASVSGDATLFGHPDMGIEIRYNTSVNINTRHTNSGTIRPATLNGKQIATVDDIAAASSSVASVNTKTGNVVLTGADIQTTYTYNSKETTTTVNAFADAVFHNIDNVTALIPTKAVTSDNVTKIVKLTQAEYDSLTTKDENTLYYIVG